MNADHIEEAPPRAVPPGRWHLATALLLAGSFAVRCWYATTLPLSGDEAYHWQWSRHLAGAYYDHGGMTGWLIFLATSLVGSTNELAVRLPAIVCGTLLALLAWQLAREIVAERGGTLGNRARAGFAAAFLVVFAPITAAFSVYMSTDPPLLLFWASTAWLVRRAMRTGAWMTWVAAGAAFGLALDTKLLALMLPGPVALVLLLASDEPWRRRLGRLVVFGGTGLLVATPLLLWNAGHDWDTFRFSFQVRHEDSPASWLYPLEFLLLLVLLPSPGVFLLTVHAVWKAWRDGLARRDRSALVLVAFSVVPLVVFFVVSLRRKVGAHWSAAAWTTAFVAAAVAWAETSHLGRRRLVRWSAMLCVALTVLGHAAPHVPPHLLDIDLSWASRPKKLRVRAIEEIYGWTILGQRVAVELASLRAAAGSAGEPFAMGNNYGTASLVAFYTPGQPNTHLWAGPLRHGEAYRRWHDWRALAGRDAVFVCKRDIADALPGLRKHFRTVDAPDELPIALRGRVVRSFWLVRCRGFDGVGFDE